MIVYEPVLTREGNFSLVVAYDPDAESGVLAEGCCIAVFAGLDAFGRASRYAAAKQRGEVAEALD